MLWVLPRRRRRCSAPAGSSSRSPPRRLVIFVIRTRRVPFFRSRPSTPLAASTFICVAIGVLLPFSPLADVLGFTALPAGFLGTAGGDDRRLPRCSSSSASAASTASAPPGRRSLARCPRPRAPDPPPRVALEHPRAPHHPAPGAPHVAGEAPRPSRGARPRGSPVRCAGVGLAAQPVSQVRPDLRPRASGARFAPTRSTARTGSARAESRGAQAGDRVCVVSQLRRAAAVLVPAGRRAEICVRL